MGFDFTSLLIRKILRKPAYFGRFGKILKIVINRHNLYNASATGGPTVSAYITFTTNEASLAAIKKMDGHILDGRQIRFVSSETTFLILQGFLLVQLNTARIICGFCHAIIQSVCICTNQAWKKTVFLKRN